MNKENIKTTDWLIRRYSEEEIARIKEEAIKEADTELMAIDLCDSLVETFGGYSQTFVLDAKETAKNMRAKGYRKASEVINEFAEELIERFNDLEYNANTPRKTVRVDELRAQVNWILNEVVVNTIKEFTEKYVETMK
jgi:hypothetical protein